MCMYFRWQQVLPKRLHFFFTKTAYFFSPKIPQNIILLNIFFLLKRWYHLWCFVTQDLSIKFAYVYTCILHHTITNLYYVRSSTCHRYGFLFFGNWFDGEAFICFYKWHFILYLHIGITSKNQLKNSKSSPKFLRNSIQKMLASVQLTSNIN